MCFFFTKAIFGFRMNGHFLYSLPEDLIGEDEGTDVDEHAAPCTQQDGAEVSTGLRRLLKRD